MAAMSPSEDSYFKTPVITHAKNRIMWLLILMLSATITGSIITKYEAAFAAVPLLVSFIPMLTGTGGNCGSQTSTMIIRGMSLGEIRLKRLFQGRFQGVQDSADRQRYSCGSQRNTYLYYLYLFLFRFKCRSAEACGYGKSGDHINGNNV